LRRGVVRRGGPGPVRRGEARLGHERDQHLDVARRRPGGVVLAAARLVRLLDLHERRERGAGRRQRGIAQKPRQVLRAAVVGLPVARRAHEKRGPAQRFEACSTILHVRSFPGCDRG
jgi:hypothetical protein